MTCAEALELVLEAEPEELTGVGNSPLAAHLRQCADCQRIAQSLHTHHAAVQAVYLSAESRRPAAAGVTRSIGPSAEGTALATTGHHLRRWVLVGVGVAAAITLMVMVRHGTPATALTHPTAPSVTTPAAPMVAQVPPNQNAIIFATRDPLISVVWFY